MDMTHTVSVMVPMMTSQGREAHICPWARNALAIIVFCKDIMEEINKILEMNSEQAVPGTLETDPTTS